MKIRMKFAKEGVMKYVGHLDMMRYFQKAIRRANLPIKYSEGFNPHQIMSFAAPLGVGITSLGEYIDIEINEEISSVDASHALNKTMVEGMTIRSFRELPETAQNAMASVAAASYKLTYKNGYEMTLSLDELQEKKKAFYDNAPVISITKKTKKSERELDLKPLIYSFDITENKDHEIVYHLMVSTGSVDNIKPELVLEHFHHFMGLQSPNGHIQVQRVDMFTHHEQGFLSLNEVGHDR